MTAAIVVPIYRSHRADLKWFEHISLKRCIEVFGGKYPIIFVAPNDRQFDYLPAGVEHSVETFDAKYFRGRDGYNELMLSPQFYARFLAYDYILIYQLDTFAFSDRLEEFCRLNYDYIGAPWSIALFIRTKANYVGNGGFCLRRVKACFDIVTLYEGKINPQFGEDGLFSLLGVYHLDIFKIAPVRVASQFSVEHLPERWGRKNANVLPFGCHGWQHFSPEFFIRAFSECGYDLTPYAHLMEATDRNGLENNLRHVVQHRLINRIQHGRPLLKYLPSNEKFFVILADEQSIVLVQRLYQEGLRIINPNSIAILSKGIAIQTLVDQMLRSGMRGLLLSLTDDSKLVDVIHNMRGGGKMLKYGINFISFWQEYMKSSTLLLRRASRPSIERLKRLGIFH